MAYKFKEFMERGRRASSIPKITITKDGNLSLNRAFIETFAKDKTHMIYHYDQVNKAIGIKLTNEEIPNSYKIRKYREGTLAFVTAQAFLKYHNIAHKKSCSYKVQYDSENDLIIMNLK